MTERSEVRSRRSAAVLALAVLLALAGCGVPGSSQPTDVGPAPAAGDPISAAGTVRVPTRDGASTALELARRFFQAGAVANWDPDREEESRIDDAVEHARQFLVPELRRSWQPGKSVLVVAADLIDGLDFVTANLVPVGVLGADGVVGPLPPAGVSPTQVKFQAVSVNGTVLLALTPDSQMPSDVMLSQEGLDTLFEARPVYFWDKANRYLVPDRRYVSRGISNEKRVRAIIKQWLAGPSDFIKNVVAPQTDITMLDNPSLSGNRVKVNLQPGGQEANQNNALRRIAWQIRWSIHGPSTTPDVEIQVAGREQLVDADSTYLTYNPSQPRAGQGSPDEDRLFGVLDGRVVPVSPSAMSPSILQQPENSGVVLAAVNRATNAAALVRRGENGRPQLWIGRNNVEPRFVQASFPAAPATLSRPSFVPGGDGRVLIAGDGMLWDVTPDGVARSVPLAVGDVTAVSVAPDGARVGLVTGGGAVVASLEASGTPAVGTPVRLYLPTVPQARGIGWLAEDRVVVGGPSALAEATIDNGFNKSIAPNNLTGGQLTQVAAVPGNPFDGTTGSVVVEVGNQQAYYAYSSGLVEIVPLPGASPSPSASASAGTSPTTPRMSAPFYVDDVR
jgi:hypothetical protein